MFDWEITFWREQNDHLVPIVEQFKEWCCSVQNGVQEMAAIIHNKNSVCSWTVSQSYCEGMISWRLPCDMNESAGKWAALRLEEEEGLRWTVLVDCGWFGHFLFLTDAEFSGFRPLVVWMGLLIFWHLWNQPHLSGRQSLPQTFSCQSYLDSPTKSGFPKKVIAG